MIRLIIFDLDGVLIDSKDTHYIALNRALKEVENHYVISRDDHIKKYDGKPTKVKLRMLTQEKKLPLDLHQHIYLRKQHFTALMLKESVKKSDRFIELFKELIDKGYILHIASNSIRETTDTIIKNLGLYKYTDFVISNEEVNKPKPDAEMYLKCMLEARTSPKETLIIEDSYVGRQGAYNSGAYLYPINKPEELTMEGVMKHIKSDSNYRQTWCDDKLNIVIPAGGAGKRFASAGYTFPKVLIDIHGKTMLQTVVENLNIDAHYIYIIQEKQNLEYNMTPMLKLITPNCDIISFDELPEGAAAAILLAKEYINNDDQLLIANSDQVIEWNSSEFMYAMQPDYIDGGILTFENTHPKWSYAKTDENGWVTEVAEKIPISKHATVGVYYYKRGSDYVKYAEQMIKKNIRTKGEFYTCPVYNEAIQDGKKIKIWEVDRMAGLGTPEDLQAFLNRER